MDMSDMEFDFDGQIAQEEECCQMADMEPPDEEPAPTSSPPPSPQKISRHSVQHLNPLVLESPSPPQSAELPFATPSAKKRRLSKKSTWQADKNDYSVSVKVSPSAEPIPSKSIEDDAWAQWFLVQDNRGKRAWAYNAIRRVAFRELLERREEGDETGATSMPIDFAKLSKAEKQEVLQWWLDVGTGRLLAHVVQAWIKENIFVHNQDQGIESQQVTKRVRSKQLMFTCQGDWGLLPAGAHRPETCDINELTENLKKMPAVQTVWQKVKLAASQWHRHLGACEYTVGLEVCSTTWAEEGVLRLHAHLAFIAAQRMSVAPKELRARKFLGSSFQVSAENAGMRRCLGWSSFYYVQAPKLGHLFHTGTKMAYDGFPVSAEWVWTLVQSKKMDAKNAKSELLRQAKCLTRHLPNLARLVAESIAHDLDEVIAAKENILEKGRTPFKVLPQVTALLKQLKQPRDRRKFLVLDGPSRMGNTLYVMSLFGKERTLEINCANEEDPAMQSFQHTQHKCVLF